MIKRNGVFITVLFAFIVTVSSVSYTFFKLYQSNSAKHTDNLFNKYSLISQIYHTFLLKQISLTILEANLAVYDLYVINSKSEFEVITKHATLLKEEGSPAVKMAEYISFEAPHQNFIDSTIMRASPTYHRHAINVCMPNYHTYITISTSGAYQKCLAYVYSVVNVPSTKTLLSDTGR